MARFRTHLDAVGPDLAEPWNFSRRPVIPSIAQWGRTYEALRSPRTCVFPCPNAPPLSVIELPSHDQLGPNAADLLSPFSVLEHL